MKIRMKILQLTVCILYVSHIHRQHSLHTSSVTVVMVTTSMSSTVLKKFIKSKLKGTLANELGDDKYLIEYETEEGLFLRLTKSHFVLL